MKAKPLHDNIIIEIIPEEKITKSGIYILDTKKDEPIKKGLIISVGSGTKEFPMTLKEGDIILYPNYAGVEVEIDGKIYLIMKESNVLAILN